MTAAPVLEPARSPNRGLERRLLLVDATTATFHDRHMTELPTLLRENDVVVVNDAATLPASLAFTSHDGELRLAAWEGESGFCAVLFGDGSWRVPTEARGPAPVLHPGDRFAAGPLTGVVTGVDPDEPRLVSLRFDQEQETLFAELYRRGRVIQYSYLERPLYLWDVQTKFAGRPLSFEAPSAGLALTFDLMTALRRRGVAIAAVSHAAGLSSTGSASLDRRLPLPERYDVPRETARAIARAREAGGRVLAVGTTVVRALESAALERGELLPGPGTATLVLGPGFRPRVVDSVLTGLHEPGTSHFSLLESLAGRDVLTSALRHAARSGYLQHEFGDACLVLGERPSARTTVRA